MKKLIKWFLVCLADVKTTTFFRRFPVSFVFVPLFWLFADGFAANGQNWTVNNHASYPVIDVELDDNMSDEPIVISHGSIGPGSSATFLNTGGVGTGACYYAEGLLLIDPSGGPWADTYLNGSLASSGGVGAQPTNLAICIIVNTNDSYTIDYYDSGDGVPPTNVDDPSDGALKTNPTPDCQTPVGMPVWQVSEPYISLWLKDEPMGYQPALGPRLSFELAFKQRESVAGLNTNVFSVGQKWNVSWLSYVAQDANSNNVVYFPGGGGRTYFTTNDYLTSTSLSGNTTSGFTVLYPDGSQDVYGFVVTNSGGGFSNAFLTARLNPQAQKTQLIYYNYNPAKPVIRLQYVIDGDGRTNSIYYATNNTYSTNLISQVIDPFGRNVSLAYDNGGHLTNITDVGGISSSFLYDTNNWVTNLMTPYGTNTFAITDATGTNLARSVQVTEPDGGTELYLFEDNALGIPFAYPLPVTTPFTNTLENDDLTLRSTYHWGRLQSTALSTTNISMLTSSDFLKARMKHWLAAAPGLVGQTLSMERAPSPDSGGTIEGQKTWYDYAGKTNTEYEGTQYQPLFVAQVLPDGTTSFTRTDRNSIGNVLTNTSTWSAGGSVALRTNLFTYNPTNGIDPITATNAMGVQIASNLFNGFHETLTHYDALNEVTSYIYNTNQQLVSATLSTGLIITNIYGSDNFVAQQIAVGLATNSFVHLNDLVSNYTDARGLSVTNTWDNLQRPTQIAYPDGTILSYAYSNLDLVQVVDRMGFTNSFAYNAIREKVSAKNALGFQTIYGYCECGALDSIQDALSNITTFSYDNESRMTGVIYADGSSVNYAYNLIGQVTNIIDGAGVSVTNWFNNQGLLVAVSNAFGQVKAVSHDILDRATNTVGANGVSINMTYDNLGRMLTRSYPDGGIESFGYSPAGMIAYTNQLTNATYYGYDAAARKIAETNANNQATQYAYDGANDFIGLTDANTHTTQWGYDIFGRLTSKTNALGATIMTYSYDADNRMTNRAMIGTTTGYTYDAVGNLKTIIYPQLTISNLYDAINELTNMTDGVGANKFSYTGTGRLQSETGPWINNTVSYAYSQGHRTNLSLTQPSASPWTQTYGYDSAWRMIGITSPAGAFGYQYSSLGNQYVVSGITLPNGASITNNYDSLGRLTGTALANQFGHVLDGCVYGLDLLGLRTNMTRNLGLTTNSVAIGYDGIDQITNWSGQETNGSLRHNEQLAYAYDAAGNLNIRTNDALIQTFTVDALNQISNVNRTGQFTEIGATPAPVSTLTVNGDGNAHEYGDFTFAKNFITLNDGINSFTNVATNLYGFAVTNIITVNLPATVTLQYDSNGNLTNDGTRSFYFDAENQLTNVSIAGQWQVAFVYDGLNRRRITRDYAWQSTNWVETNEVRYLYDGMLVLQERDTNNNPQVTYTRGLDLSLTRQGGGGIGGLLARTDATGSYYFHSDGSGNVTALMDGYQNVVARYRYDAFGKLIGQWGSLANVNRYRFSSMEFFANAGIYGYPRRFYEPSFQRWLNRDPIQELGGFNLYRFVGNDPNAFIDPDGLGVGSVAISIGTDIGEGIGIGAGAGAITVSAPGLAAMAGAVALGVGVAGIIGSLPPSPVLYPDPDSSIGQINAPPQSVSAPVPGISPQTGAGRGNPGERRQQRCPPNPGKTGGKPDNQTGKQPNVPEPKEPDPTPPPPKNPYDPGPWWRNFPDTPPKDFLPPGVT
jgi:RHS repeat-associated protein